MGNNAQAQSTSFQAILNEMPWWTPDPDDLGCGQYLAPYERPNGTGSYISAPFDQMTDRQRALYMFHVWFAQPDETAITVGEVNVNGKGIGIITTRRLLLLPFAEFVNFDIDESPRRRKKALRAHRVSAVRPMTRRGPISNPHTQLYENITSIQAEGFFKSKANIVWLGHKFNLSASKPFITTLISTWQNPDRRLPTTISTPVLVDDPPFEYGQVGLVCDWCGATIDTEPEVGACGGCVRNIDWTHPDVITAKQKAKNF